MDYNAMRWHSARMTDKQLTYIENLLSKLDIEEEEALALADLSHHDDLDGLTIPEASQLIEALIEEKETR